METIIRTLPNNYKIKILPHTEMVICEVWKDLCYERHYSIKKQDIIIDIGANQGIFSLYAAHKGARVYAVEPDLQNYTILKENIIRNGLENTIISFHCAVTRHCGSVSFFTPDAEHINSSTCATTSYSQIKSLAKHNCAHIKMSLVKTLSLSSLLQKIREKRINLLKIDTEGAEVDILSGVESGDLENIDRIVMETHNAYPENELYHRVRELGFQVIAYDKLSGIFETGYLYAEQRCRKIVPVNSAVERKKPVAVLDAPKAITLGNEVIVSGEKSFSTINETNEHLTYHFTINKGESSATYRSKQSIRFTKPGPHRIVLDVCDNEVPVPCGRNEECTSNKRDSAETIIWVFSPEYGPSPSAISLKEMGEKHEFFLDSEKAFIIPESELPKDWDYGAICLGIHLSEVIHNNGSAHPSILFSINSEKRIINTEYEELYFPGFPRECDLCFSIEPEVECRVILQWFTKPDPGKNPPKNMICHVNEIYELGKESLNHICHIEGNTSFVINNNDLPHGWRPSRIKLGISIHSSDPVKDSMEGIVECNNFSVILDGKHKEICLCPDYRENSLVFHLQVPGCRVYQLVWWYE